MDALYHNPILTVFLSLLAIIIIGNSGLQLYMLNAPPVVIEKEFDHNGAAGYSLGPLIYINPTEPATRYRVLRHEYQHYMQQSLLTPLGFLGFYIGEYLLEGSFDNVSFEQEAVKKENDSLEFEVFNIKTFKKMKVYPDMEGIE